MATKAAPWLVAGAFAAALGSACTAVPPCSTTNCHGCCDAKGVCQEGNQSNACGKNGNACQTCSLACGSGACAGSAGGSDAGAEHDAGNNGGLCGTYAPPSMSASCSSCTAGGSSCQANGCYGGWWCDTSTNRCQSAPSGCGQGSDGGGGVIIDAGVYDGGPPTGTVGNSGGTVSRMYFAIIGDTRPANIDDTANYPTAAIQKIYSDLAALNPRPQFAIATGDYQFATPTTTNGPTQIGLYTQAEAQFPNPVFKAMGNHECTGYTASLCPAGTTGNNNFDAYLSQMVTPLGYQVPYYSVPINASDGSWTAKIVVTACNAWDSTQSAWFKNAMAQSTTYTFVVRHEPTGEGPCASDMDAVLSTVPYSQFIVGHVHTYQHSGKEIIVGNGGAPTSGATGYVTVEQQPGIGFKVTEYDYSTSQPLDVWYFQ